MRGSWLKVLVVVAIVLGLPGAGWSGVLPPGSTVAGKTLPEWSAAWWQWAFSYPTPINPLKDETGQYAYLGNQGPVFFLGGVINVSGTATRSVTIPSNAYVFFPVLNTEANFIEYPGPDVNYLVGVNDFYMSTVILPSLQATLDGVPIPNVADHRETVGAPGFPMTLPPDNLLESFGFTFPGGVVDPTVSDGWWLMLEPLPPGPHVLTFTGTYGDPINFTLSIRYNILVEAVPEPGSLALLGIGGVLLAGWQRGRLRAARR